MRPGDWITHENFPGSKGVIQTIKDDWIVEVDWKIAYENNKIVLAPNTNPGNKTASRHSIHNLSPTTLTPEEFKFAFKNKLLKG